MIKKLITIILTVVMIVPYAVYAKSNDAENIDTGAIEALEAFGVIMPEDAVEAGKDFTRKDAALWLYRALGLKETGKVNRYADVTDNDQYADAISALSELGYFQGYEDGKFYPNSSMKYVEFVKILVDALGGGKFAAAYGGYPGGYLNLAKDKELKEDVSCGDYDTLIVADAAQVMQNAMMVNRIGISEILGDKAQFESTAGKSLLSVYFGIDYAKGRMTANSVTSLTSADGAGVGQVEIGGIIYTDPNNAADGFLGKEVYVYYNEDDEVVFVEESGKEYNYMKLEAQEILADESTRTEIRYDDNDKTRKKKISDVVDIIYNGKAYPDLRNIYPETGEIELLDYDNDEVFDLIFVTDYESVVVSGYSEISRTLSAKYPLASGNKFLTFEEDAELIVTSADGEEAALSDMSAGNILMIAKAHDDPYYILKICDKSVTGTLSSRGDKEITVNGEVYELSEQYKKYLAAGEFISPQTGKEYTFYLDLYGRVAGYEANITGRQYGFLKKCYVDTDEETGDEMTVVKIFCQDDSWKTLRVKDKVRLNNDSVKAELLPTLIDLNKMIRFELDSKDRVKKIETATHTDYTEADYERLVKNDTFRYATRNSSTGSNSYLLNTHSIFENYYMDSDVYTFSIPNNPATASEDNFAVSHGTSFSSESYYNIEIYDPDEYHFASIFVKYVNAGSGEDKLDLGRYDNYFMVTKSGKVVVDDEIADVIYGIQSGKEWSYTSSEPDVFSRLKRGDLIRINYDTFGEVSAYQLIHSLGKEDVFSNSTDNGVHDPYVNICGIVKKIDAEKGRIVIDEGTQRAFRLPNGTTTTMYKKDTKEVKSASVSDIKIGDYVCLRLWFGITHEIAVYSM